MDNKFLQFIVSLFIPPLAVYMKTGKIDNTFWLNIVLTILGGIPGLLHAWYVIFAR
ncbi:MAG: YqaE/Pmp3 family membrane protein [Anaerolineales bacterium]|nr:MAG: YqaE/Pmp3 family membrane protein [Anaerolineales bacterium]